MAKFFNLPTVFKFSRFLKSSFVKCEFSTVSLTQQEVSTALRPFYFAVHPDLFYRFPTEKQINENSLKQLNFYLETVLKNLPTNPVSLTFCLKNGSQKVNGAEVSFKHVNIQLLGKDLHHVLHNILSSCHLPTEYLDSLQKEKAKRIVSPKTQSSAYQNNQNEFWWNETQKTTRDIEERIRNEPDIDFRFWLNENVHKALHKLRASQPLRDETERLCKELRETLKLKDVLWNCGWGITHFRGCLQSFKGLLMHHPEDMHVLNGRTVVFGRQTGVSFEGHIILSSEDVRSNWLDMIHSVDKFDELLEKIPASERALSDVLRGIAVDHRKFQPTIMVQNYTQQLGKLTSALYKFKWSNGFPISWPRRLHNFQIVVECEAGPLMLSPTGQFIVPASCPAFLLVDFISKHMDEASRLLEQYNYMKTKEQKLHTLCMSKFGLSALEKDDNITPKLMVQCCEQLLRNSALFGSNLRDLKLRISHYYSVLQDGVMCIPWDWKTINR